MQVSANTQVYETELSLMWFDEDGVFCTVTKKDVTITKERLQFTFEFIRSQCGDNKICWLGDITKASFPTDEARDYAGEETPKLIKALALITNSVISRLVANVFLTLKKPPYPTRMFTSEQNAREWLRQYL
jgi:hypothetical protein